MDAATSRTWKKCPAGYDGCEGGVSGSDGDDLTEAQAREYCAALVWAGQDDWRTPDVYEALSLVDIRELDISHNRSPVHVLEIKTEDHEISLQSGTTWGLGDPERPRKGMCVRSGAP
jgi:hypothetical protein